MDRNITGIYCCIGCKNAVQDLYLHAVCDWYIRL